jgi:hypothetical protein
MIIGAPKSIDEIPPFQVNTITELIEGMNQQLAAGTPVDVPTMLPIGQLAQMAKTLKVYHALVFRLAALKGVEEDEKADPDIADNTLFAAELGQLREEAQALLAQGGGKDVMARGRSRIILPS